MIGIEPTTFSLGSDQPTAQVSKKATPCDCVNRSASDSASDCGEEDAADLDLRAVVSAWPTLPEAVRVGVLAMVEAARKGGSRG